MKTIHHKTLRDCEIVVTDTPRKINAYGIVLDLTAAEADKLAKIGGFYVMAEVGTFMPNGDRVEREQPVEALTEDEPAEAEDDSTEDDEAGEDGEVTADSKPVQRQAKKRGRPAGRRGK